jgi:hypothetical protein
MPPTWELADVRVEARQAGLGEIYHNPQSAVVSFSSTQSGFKRLNVYYTTGTVGTCITHPSQGSTQLFRRNVALDLLKQLMRQPRVHTGAGYHRKRPRDENRPPGRPVPERGDDDYEEYGPDPADEETEALAERLRLQAEAAAVAARLAEVDAVLAEYSRRRQQLAAEQLAAEQLRQQKLQQQAEAAAAAAAQAAYERALIVIVEAQRQEVLAKAHRLHARGAHYEVSISNAESQAAFMQRCGTTDSFKTVKHATVCNGGFFIGRDNGKSYWSNLPWGLVTRLVDENLNFQGALKYVAAGSDNTYYAELTNGSIWWASTGLNEDDSFDAVVNGSRAISRVEFGERGSWVILYGDGGYTWGSGLPTKMHNKLRSRNPRLPMPVEISLGPNDTWFVRYSDGKTDWELPPDVSDRCNRVYSEGGGEVTSVSMCVDSSDYMVRSTVFIPG